MVALFTSHSCSLVLPFYSSAKFDVPAIDVRARPHKPEGVLGLPDVLAHTSTTGGSMWAACALEPSEGLVVFIAVVRPVVVALVVILLPVVECVAPGGGGDEGRELRPVVWVELCPIR